LSVILTIALILRWFRPYRCHDEYVSVTAGLRLRSGPSFNYSTIASNNTGTMVEILATSAAGIR
jgi:uncharacterized protein YgiM (DUF1202 family)